MRKKRFKLNSIRTKLITSLIAICIIPLIISGYISYMKSKEILNKKITLTSTQTLAEVNESLLEYFIGLDEIVSISAENYHFVNIDSEDNSTYIPDLLKNIKEQKKELLAVYYGTESGQFAIYPETELPADFNPTERPWYQKALESKGKIVITPPYVDAITGDNVVTIARAVEKDGTVVGVMAMDCTLSTLAEKIASKKVGSTGYVFIADINGMVIAHPNKELINTDTPAKLSFWDEVRTEDNGFVSYEYNGMDKFGVYQTNEITGWKLVATMDISELSKDTKAIIINTLFIIAVITLVSVIMSILLSNGISRNIKELKRVFAKASEGDLTVNIAASTKDEFKDLAESFNAMIKNISSLMKSVTESSETVLETSSILADMSQDVTASISEVARAIEEVSNGAINQAQDAQDSNVEMENLSAKLDLINENSNVMEKLSNDTKILSSKGLSMIDILIDKSNHTKVSTTNVNTIVVDMYESAKQINAISDTLSSITSQTNLLSLNASIESARAGEAGRGFAVVANEIRLLAEQSTASTEDIKGIIAGIQKKTDAVLEAIQSTQAVVNEQDVAVNQTKKIFDDILVSIERMIKQVDEVRTYIFNVIENKKTLETDIESISAISEETASASEEVTASTEEITATMEEFTRYSVDLKKLANQLEIEINRFEI